MTQEKSVEHGTTKNNAAQEPAINEANVGIGEIAELFGKEFLGGSEESTGTPAPEGEEGAGAQAASEESQVETPNSEETEEETQVSEETDVEETEPASEETETTNAGEEEIENGLPKGVKKRIDGLIEEKRTLKNERDELKAKIERLERESSKTVQAQVPALTHEHIQTVEELNKAMATARDVRDWCEENADGIVTKDKDGNEIEYTPEQIRKIKINARKDLEVLLPQRAQYLQTFTEVEKIAVNEYPYWKDKSDKKRILAEQIINSFPEIKRFPDYKLIVSDLIEGNEMRAKKKKAAATTVTKVAPAVPKSTVAPKPATSKEAIERAALKNFVNKGTRESLSEVAKRFI